VKVLLNTSRSSVELVVSWSLSGVRKTLFELLQGSWKREKYQRELVNGLLSCLYAKLPLQSQDTV